MLVYHNNREIDVTNYEVVDGVEYMAIEAYYVDTDEPLTHDEMSYLGEAIMWAKEASR